MAQYITISSKQICRCSRCGAPITFVTAKVSGKRFPADVVKTPDGTQWAYTRNGNHNNFIERHECVKLDPGMSKRAEFDRKVEAILAEKFAAEDIEDIVRAQQFADEYRAMCREYSDITGSK